MKDCKYKLPCGYCDKYNIRCKATAEDLMRYNILQDAISTEQIDEIAKKMKETLECECNHNWEHSCYLVESGCETQRCSKCGATRLLKRG